MPAPVHDAHLSHGTSPPPRKSNAWPNEERDDIYHRRQQGEKWDTICLDYPGRSKHAMQQQYSIMKKQAILKTPTKGRGRRKAQSIATASPTVVNGRNGFKQRPSSADVAQSDADDDDESTASSPIKSMGGNDGPPVTDDDSESVKEPDSARKQRMRRRLKQTSANEDEDELPVSTRPKRTRASGVNYNILQNSGFGLDDPADDVAADPTPSNTPHRLSKTIVLKTGKPKTPVADQAKKPSKGLNSDSLDDRMQSPEDDGFTRRSQRVKKVSNAKSRNANSPAVDDESSILGGKRRRRSYFPQDPEPEPSIDDDSDQRATRSSRKRKNSEAEPRRASVASASGSVDQPSTKKRRQGKPNEHLGFLPNGQPRQRRRRVSATPVISKAVSNLL
ncbi:MAG: hypothetical protein Q9168_004165 [Polycauliona sp. 1 TL-2023]